MKINVSEAKIPEELVMKLSSGKECNLSKGCFSKTEDTYIDNCPGDTCGENCEQ